MIIGRIDNPDPRIPVELQAMYGRLAGSFIDTLGVLDELTVLFSTSEEAVTLMNKAAATFFSRHQQLLVHHIILSVSRYTDPEQSGGGSGQENFVLSRLLALEPEHQKLRDDLETRLKEIKALAQPLRQYRHKLLAHASMAEFLDPAATIGSDITVGSMRDVLMKIGEYISAFEGFFTGNDAPFYYFRGYGEAADLLEYLKLGLEAEKQQYKRRE